MCHTQAGPPSISEEAQDLALLLHHNKSSKLQPASAHKQSMRTQHAPGSGVSSSHTPSRAVKTQER